MAITSAVCNSFKTEVLQALHNFTASSGNSFKLALYTSSATLNKSTTAYSTSNNSMNVTNYTGAAAAAAALPAATQGDVCVYVQSKDTTGGTATLTFDAAGTDVWAKKHRQKKK